MCPFPCSWLERGLSWLELGRASTWQEGSCMGRTALQHHTRRLTLQSLHTLPGLFCERNKTCVLFKLLYVGDCLLQKNQWLITAISNSTVHDYVPGTGLQPLNPHKNPVMWALLFPFTDEGTEAQRGRAPTSQPRQPCSALHPTPPWGLFKTLQMSASVVALEELGCWL